MGVDKTTSVQRSSALTDKCEPHYDYVINNCRLKHLVELRAIISLRTKKSHLWHAMQIAFSNFQGTKNMVGVHWWFSQQHLSKSMWKMKLS